MEVDMISLKWGTWKEWAAVSDKAVELKERYFKIGSSVSAMAQRDTAEQKTILCDMIDLVPGEVYLEWDGKCVSKEEAKEYVMNYGKEKAAV